MEPIGLNELPRYSPWVSRLLGLQEFKSSKKDLSNLLREFDKDKYGKYLSYFRAHKRATMESIRWIERGRKKKERVCISRSDKLFVAPAEEVFKLEEKIFLDALGPLMKQVDTVVDLGAGYGYLISLLAKKYPKHEFIGGELSQNAVKLSKHLLKNKNVKVLPFNFYDKNWEVFKNLKSKQVLVISYYGVHYLPEASLFTRHLRKNKSCIRGVINFEPVYELYDPNTTLGQMRRRYMEMNNYNTNLLTTLKKESGAIRIQKIQPNVLGLNPLLPLSIIHWKFK